MKLIANLNKNKIDLEDIKKFYKIYDYMELYELVVKLIDEGDITPVKSSERNGKSPALHKRYKVVQKNPDNSEYINELNYNISSYLNTDYYRNNIEKYKEDRNYVLSLNEYIKNRQGRMETKVSLNERSFEIWGREKFLQKEGGKSILKKLGLSLDDLYIYETTEPLPYYSHNKNTPQNVLILENKDTFYSMRRYLINSSNKIMGTDIGTLVYGGGKNINKTFEDFSYCVEPYLGHKDNTILYLGDIDYEGIVIYESLKGIFEKGHNIKPFISGYKVMVDKYLNGNVCLPKTKEGQNRNISNVFLSEFTEEYMSKINEILIAGKYIPQEILNISDF